MSRLSYRSSYESLVDDADYQALSPLAQAVFHTLKLKLGMYGIAVLYTGVLEEIHRCASPHQVTEALRELEAKKTISGAGGWIRRERNVVWLVNGLKFDPAFTTGNANNRKGAIAYARSLPRLALIDEFLSYYGLTTPSGTPSPTPLPTPSPTPGGSTETETETETESGKRSEKGEGESTSPVEKPAQAANDPPADAGKDPANRNGPADPLLDSVPIRRFLEAFYPVQEKTAAYSVVLRQTRRRDDVLRQLRASLTSAGTKLDRTTIVRSCDLAHLETYCADVDASAIRDPDKAIRVLLIKLRDTWAETRASRENPPEIPRGRAIAPDEPTSIHELLRRRKANE